MEGVTPTRLEIGSESTPMLCTVEVCTTVWSTVLKQHPRGSLSCIFTVNVLQTASSRLLSTWTPCLMRFHCDQTPFDHPMKSHQTSSSTTLVATRAKTYHAKQEPSERAGLSNIRPTGQNRTTRGSNPAVGRIAKVWKCQKHQLGFLKKVTAVPSLSTGVAPSSRIIEDCSMSCESAASVQRSLVCWDHVEQGLCVFMYKSATSQEGTSFFMNIFLWMVWRVRSGGSDWSGLVSRGSRVNVVVFVIKWNSFQRLHDLCLEDGNFIHFYFFKNHFVHNMFCKMMVS